MARLKPTRLAIRRSDRVCFIGATGSGKTTLAKSLLWGQTPVYALDPKRTLTLPEHWPGGVLVVEGRETSIANRAEEGTLIIRPGVDDIVSAGARMDWANDWLWYAFNRGRCIVYVDEVMMITTPNKWPDGLSACLQLGRERGVATWTATQRPTMVPLIILTESQHFFVFRLKNPDDRKRLADYTDPELQQPTRDTFGFWYYSDDSGPRYYQRADVGILAGSGSQGRKQK